MMYGVDKFISGSHAVVSSLAIITDIPMLMDMRHDLSPSEPRTNRLLSPHSAMMLNMWWQGNGDTSIPSFLLAPACFPWVGHLFTSLPLVARASFIPSRWLLSVLQASFIQYPALVIILSHLCVSSPFESGRCSHSPST
jgi:hypothetical protein